MNDRIVIGTRGSKLALAQSEGIADEIRALMPGVLVEIEVIRTRGDKIQDTPLAKIGGKGLFTKEIEVALLEGRVDLAVHSMKDLPTELPEGLELGAVPSREIPCDVLVCERWSGIEELPAGATVGTSSLRRSAQLRIYRPDLEIVDLRGNVDTRLRRVHDGDLDAAVLACAGLRRLGHEAEIRQMIPMEIMVPAVGQGALAIESRVGDGLIAEVLRRLDDATTRAEVSAERACLACLEGGCQVPIGALARVGGETLSLNACVCAVDGSRMLRARVEGPVDMAESLGRNAARALLEQGAGELIESAR